MLTITREMREHLDAWMTFRGLGPKALAKKSGIAPDTVYRLFRGDVESIRSETLEKLVRDGLGLESVDQLWLDPIEASRQPSTHPKPAMEPPGEHSVDLEKWVDSPDATIDGKPLSYEARDVLRTVIRAIKRDWGNK